MHACWRQIRQGIGQIKQMPRCRKRKGRGGVMCTEGHECSIKMSVIRGKTPVYTHRNEGSMPFIIIAPHRKDQSSLPEAAGTMQTSIIVASPAKENFTRLHILYPIEFLEGGYQVSSTSSPLQYIFAGETLCGFVPNC